MLDQVEVARILDILGNRNRRRIIELLRQKPCFVTEISDRLVLSPKAVIEHLQMMEREEILSFRLDERRRKYYYLAHDINVMVTLEKHPDETVIAAGTDNLIRFRHTLHSLRQLLDARDEMVQSLKNLDDDIENRIKEIISRGKEILDDDTGIDISIALAHCPLSGDEIHELTGLPPEVLSRSLKRLKEQRIIDNEGKIFRLCDNHAE
jgi:ArsR family transcriptional regulator